ncbi:TRI25 ligase, partial [Polypterus senegalus]
MAEAELFGLQNEITCFICQETLSDPVSILCGHSFCLKCLNDYWDQSHECSCPECRRTFTTRPELQRNTVLNEFVKKIKKPRLGPHPSQSYAGPGDVECDACTGMKFKAVKSCLTCMASYCPTHLQPHFEIAAWKDHKLTDPDGNLKVELCVKHQKRLEIFCKNEEMCICMMCALTEHEGHEKVELEMEKAEKQSELEVTWSEIRRRLEEREKTLKEMKKAEEQMKISVENELEKHEKSFTDLICSIGKTKKKLIEKIREQEKTEMEKIEGVRDEMEKEIKELKRKDVELRELSETKDHNRFLQGSDTGEGRNSHNARRRAHNQRIESLWRQVYEHVLDLFFHILYNLEAEGQLSPDSDFDIFIGVLYITCTTFSFLHRGLEASQAQDNRQPVTCPAVDSTHSI